MSATAILSKGVILQYICKGDLPPSSRCTFQVMGTRKINAPKSETHDMVKYRISISDGEYRFSQAVIMLDNEDQVPDDLSVIYFDPNNEKNSLKLISDKLILVIGQFRVIKQVDTRIGNPVSLPPDAYQLQDEAQPGPSTPSSSAASNKEPPPLPQKRPLVVSPTNNVENKAKQARRNLFPAKTTHCIKDLNPYQNKYTIQARVTKKSTKKTWSNSRGEGCVFDFVLKDASGDIKVTAFNEEVNKYFDSIHEGQVYYLSNAKIQPVRKPEYNNTDHNYELTLLNHSVIEASQDRNNDVPNIEYNFTKLNDLQNVNDKEKVDVLVVVTKVNACVNQSLRSGRDTKKREVMVADDSKTEIMMTLWGDNAVKYDTAAFEGKIVAIRSVMVTDWNGKSLSCSFGSSIEVEPRIPPADSLREYAKTGEIFQGQQSLTTDRSRPNVEGAFVCIKEINDEYQEGSNNSLTKYYNLCAYLTDLKADKIMYKACPADKCNKMVVDMSNGNYKCEKCQEQFPEFHWRYIVRGAIADATGYQWITLFDESARKIIGKSASEMAEIKERGDERGFKKILHDARYRHFNFSVKTSKETWNDENRLKVSVVNVEAINVQKHVERLRKEIMTLKMEQ